MSSVTVGNSLFYVEEIKTHAEISEALRLPLAPEIKVIWAGDNLTEAIRVKEGTVPDNQTFRTVRLNNNQMDRLATVYKERDEAIDAVADLLSENQSLYLQLGKEKETERNV